MRGRVRVLAVSGAAALLIGLVAGCSAPGIVPARWVRPAWVDPLTPLRSHGLTVWAVVPAGNPFALAKPRIVRRATGLGQVRSQTAGSFGVSTTDLPAAAKAANTAAVPQPDEPELRHDPQFDVVAARLRTYMGGVDIKNISADDVNQDLHDAMLSGELPDVVLGNPLPRELAALGYLGELVNLDLYRVPQGPEDSGEPQKFTPQALLIIRSSSMDVERARALAILLSGAPTDRVGWTPESDAAATVAARAFCQVMQGGSMEQDADPEMVRAWDGRGASRLMQPERPGWSCNRVVLANGAVRPPPLLERRMQVDTIAAFAAEGSATVMLRSTATDGRQLEMRHAVMILRWDFARGWRVLHLGLDQAVDQQLHTQERFRVATLEAERVYRNEATMPLGISQAAPLDHDRRPPQPDLWWDNLGGATLQVVEWRRDNSPSALFFIRDNTNRLQTRVNGRFFIHPGTYRWRVWSVGADGTIVLSAWRTLGIGG